MDRRFKSGLKVGLVAVAMVLGPAGCNTMEGMGEDIEQAGEAIEEEAEEGE